MNSAKSPRKVSDARRVIRPNVWVVCIAFTALAVAMSDVLEFWVHNYLRPDRAENHWHVYVASFIGAMLGSVCVFTLSRFYGTNEHVPVFEVFPPRKTLVKIFGWSFLLAALLSFLTNFLTNRKLSADIVKEPGWLFEVVFAVVAVVGLWLAYDGILESRRIITSFADLYDRMLAMTQETADDETHKLGPLRILAYTPAIGFLALSNNMWDKLRANLMRLVEGRLEIVCLDHDDLEYWHNQYIGRQTRRKPVERMPGETDLLGIADTQLATGESDRLMKYPQVQKNSRRKKLEMMPGFYLIFNNVKAIIVAPLFTPFPDTLTPSQQQIQKRVQMLGFETSDNRIIEDVMEFFEHYKETVPDKPLHFDSEVGNFPKISSQLMKQIELLKSGDLANEPLLRYRLSVVKAESWEEDDWQKILQYFKTYKKLDSQDYEKLGSTHFDHIENGTLFVRVSSKEAKELIQKHLESSVADASKLLELPFKQISYVFEEGAPTKAGGNN